VGGPCWNYRYSGENFCGQDCSTQSCPATYSCGSDKQCELPGADPSCVKLSPTMEVGDTLDDFAMVGYVDTTHNNSLVDEAQSQQPKVVKLSDFASTAKVILFTGAAGWCTSCQKETGTFAQLMTTYGPQGLMIVQALFDTDTEFEPATVAFLKTWIGAFKPAGACGVDPGWDTVAWNTTSATPLNIIIEAKTRKILSKFYSATGVETEIKKALGM
jgi:thiol-disulfide isomerase/thioredoxin